MKKYLMLALFVFAFSAKAQTVTGVVTDSIGTANTHWQKVDLFNSSIKGVEALNDGAVNLAFALTATDTVVSKTRYQRRIQPGEVLKVYTNQRYVYVKAASATCAYRIGTY